MKRKIVISIEGVNAGYKKQPNCLEDLNLKVRAGEILTLVGLNGSGKSSVLKLITGLLEPRTGEVNVFSNAGEVAYISQDMGLIANLSVLQNVRMGALRRIGFCRSILKSFPKDEKELAEKILEDLGLTEKADCKVSSLSGGQKRRVAIGRALMQKPKIMLADEILGNLDVQSVQGVGEILQNLRNTYGLTIVMVEHDLNFVKGFSDRVFCLDAGKFMSMINLKEYELFFQPGPALA